MKRRRVRGYRLPRGQKKIVYFNGYEMRNLYPDLDIMAIKGSYPNIPIPEGELWIDERYHKEWRFLLAVSNIEDEKVKLKWPHWRIRRYLKTHLTKKGPKPNFIVRSERRGRLTICYVRGDVVRQWDDPFFYLGGHGRVYPYIPRNEVWIDIVQDSREIEDTIFHEIDEWKRMKLGAGYNKAHCLTTIEEHKRRIRKFAVGLEERQCSTNGARRQRFKPLMMEPFMQLSNFCGPASLKICLSYFGKRYSEKRLAKFCGCTTKDGTYHAGMIKGALAINGASVHTVVGASLDVLRRFLWQERLPVLVGWFSPKDPKCPDEPEGDHYSVVYRITPRYIYLMDPDEMSGRCRLPLKKFLKNWWDIDEGNKRVHRWCMVINFDNQTFDTPRGVNY